MHQTFELFFYLILSSLFLVVSVNRVVDGIVETTALLALNSHTGDEVTHIDHVAELAEILAYLHTLEEILGLFVKKVEAIPGTFQTEVAADNTYIRTHNLVHFLHTLRNEHHFFRRTGSFVIPFGNIFIIRILIDHL